MILGSGAGCGVFNFIDRFNELQLSFDYMLGSSVVSRVCFRLSLCFQKTFSAIFFVARDEISKMERLFAILILDSSRRHSLPFFCIRIFFNQYIHRSPDGSTIILSDLAFELSRFLFKDFWLLVLDFMRGEVLEFGEKDGANRGSFGGAMSRGFADGTDK